MTRLYINQTLDKQIREYCSINNIEDINAFANRCVLQGLNILKYGFSPSDNVNRENNSIKDTTKNTKKKETKNSVKQTDVKEEKVELKEKDENVKTKKIRIIKK